MAENDLKVIVKAKELAVHGNCYRLGNEMDMRIQKILNQEMI